MALGYNNWTCSLEHIHHAPVASKPHTELHAIFLATNQNLIPTKNTNKIRTKDEHQA